MALTLTNRVEGVDHRGRRIVEYTATFDNGDAADITHATSGFVAVEEVWLKTKTASGIAIDITTNNATKITLDPSASGAGTIRIVGW
jgi:uncharacterized protein YchJ